MLNGQAEPGATVQISDGSSKTPLAAVTAGADGTYAASLTGLKDDTCSFTAVATDAAGNVGKPSDASAVTIDTVAPATPAAPTLTPGSDTGTLHDDGTAGGREGRKARYAPGGSRFMAITRFAPDGSEDGFVRRDGQTITSA